MTLPPTALATIAMLSGALVACAGGAPDAKFPRYDACADVVRDSMRQHDRLRWSSYQAEVGPGEVVAVADGFAPGQNLAPVRRWTRYHRDSRLGEPPKDVLTGLVWETDPVTLQRKMRTEFVSLDCRLPSG